MVKLADRLPAACVLATAGLAGLRGAGVVSWPWWTVAVPSGVLAGTVLAVFAGILATAVISQRAPRAGEAPASTGSSPAEYRRAA